MEEEEKKEKKYKPSKAEIMLAIERQVQQDVEREIELEMQAEMKVYETIKMEGRRDWRPPITAPRRGRGGRGRGGRPPTGAGYQQQFMEFGTKKGPGQRRNRINRTDYKQVDTQSKTVPCTLCGEWFITWEELRRHQLYSDDPDSPDNPCRGYVKKFPSSEGVERKRRTGPIPRSAHLSKEVRTALRQMGLKTRGVSRAPKREAPPNRRSISDEVKMALQQVKRLRPKARGGLKKFSTRRMQSNLRGGRGIKQEDEDEDEEEAIEDLMEQIEEGMQGEIGEEEEEETEGEIPMEGDEEGEELTDEGEIRPRRVRSGLRNLGSPGRAQASTSAAAAERRSPRSQQNGQEEFEEEEIEEYDQSMMEDQEGVIFGPIYDKQEPEDAQDGGGGEYVEGQEEELEGEIDPEDDDLYEDDLEEGYEGYEGEEEQLGLKSRSVFPCPVCHKKFGELSLARHRQGYGPRECPNRFYQKCPVCNAPFDNKYKLKLHLNRHINSKREIYVKCTCKKCGRIFDSKENLYKHLCPAFDPEDPTFGKRAPKPGGIQGGHRMRPNSPEIPLVEKVGLRQRRH